MKNPLALSALVVAAPMLADKTSTTSVYVTVAP